MEGHCLNKAPRIRPDMTVLEVLRTYRKTEEIFKKYDMKSGECIMCTALFQSLQQVSERFGLNLKKFLMELEAASQ